MRQSPPGLAGSSQYWWPQHHEPVEREGAALADQERVDVDRLDDVAEIAGKAAEIDQRVAAAHRVSPGLLPRKPSSRRPARVALTIAAALVAVEAGAAQSSRP